MKTTENKLNYRHPLPNVKHCAQTKLNPSMGYQDLKSNFPLNLEHTNYLLMQWLITRRQLVIKIKTELTTNIQSIFSRIK